MPPETSQSPPAPTPGAPAEPEIDRFAPHRQLALDAITDFAYVFDTDGRFTFVNKPLLDLWGLTLEQAAGKNFFDLNYPPDLAAKLQRQIQEVIHTRRKLVDETPYTSPTGKAGFYQYIFTPVIGNDGAVQAVAGSTRDISDHRELQKDRENLVRTVEAERAKLAAIIENAPAFMCTLRGPEHIFELANERYYEIIGLRDILGKPVRQALPELEGQGFFELLDRVYQTGEAFTANAMVAMLRRKGGDALEKRYLNIVYQAVRDTDGRVSGIFAHGVDVTDMALTREALRESELRFRQIADAMPQIVWAATPDGALDYYNKRWFEYINVPADAADAWEKARWDQYVHAEDLPRAGELWAAALQSGNPYQIEFRVRGGDGVYRWFLVRAAPVRDEARAITRWFGTCTDIDAIKRLTAEREHLLQREYAARDEAESANRAKDKFIAVLSHELRTPLSPVVMSLSLMELDADLPFTIREDLAMIRRNIDLEVKLIDDLLDLSRVTTGKLRLQMVPVGVHEVLRYAAHSSLSDTAGKHLRITEELSARNDRVLADAARLQQIFWNLLRNAVKFTPEGGAVSVRTWNSPGGGRLNIEVKDSGVGIPAAVLPKVFDAFEQGDARMTRQFGGLGLGLAIAKAVVELHGGTITAASPGRDQGATFTVSLETTAGRIHADVPESANLPNTDRTVHPARVLLVEDHEDTARIMSRVLRSSGFEVTTAHNVAAALAIAAKQQFDILVSDIGLPDTSGYELMREMRRLYNLKGIALSGYGMEDDARKSREAGFSDHIVKPVNIAHLEAAMRRVIESKDPVAPPTP